MKEKMTFSSLIDKIAEKTGATKTQVHHLLSEAIALNQEHLENEGRSVLPGLGRFSIKWQKARTGRNPSTGKVMDIPAHNTIKFTALPSLRKHINRKYEGMEAELLKAVPSEIKKPEPVPKGETPTIIRPAEKETKKKPPQKKRSNWFYKYGWSILLVFILLLLLLIFWPSSESNNQVKPNKTEAPITAEKEKAEIKNPEVQKSEEMTPETKISSSDASIHKPAAYPAGKHRAMAGEYIYMLSKNYYQADFIWPLVFQANRLSIKNPDILPVGSEIVFPALQQSPNNLSEMDKKNLAQAYYEVYLYYKNSDRKKALHFLWVVSQLHKKTLEENNIVREDLESIGLMKVK